MPATHTSVAPHWVAVLTGLAAVALVLLPSLWRVGTHVNTVFHEGGHALFAGGSGRTVHAVTLGGDGTGLTAFSGRKDGPGHLLALLAGYLGPPFFGLIGAVMLAGGSLDTLLWLVRAGLVALLVVIRNTFGAVVVGALLLASLLVSWWAGHAVQVGFAYLLVWFLLLSAARDMVSVTSSFVRGKGGAADVALLRADMLLPSVVWMAIFWLVTIGALVLGYHLLMDRPPS